MDRSSGATSPHFSGWMGKTGSGKVAGALKDSGGGSELPRLRLEFPGGSSTTKRWLEDFSNF
jgi:hypothetical protein